MSLPELALLLVVAAFFGIIAKSLKQPVFIGYLFAGILISYFGFAKNTEVIASLGKIGIALLLFLVGIEMDLRQLPSIGKTAFLVGVGQIVLTALLGFIFTFFLGYSLNTSLYLSMALSFSSTIVAINLIAGRGDLGSLYGKVSIGILLVQDIVAILILVFLSSAKTGSFQMMDILIILAKVVILFGGVWVLSKKILPTLFSRFITNSPEVLFVGSIAWALGVAALVGGPLGFSFEIGGFLAGLALSNLPEHIGIASKTRPLRDFFLTIFFITLGTQLVVGDITANLFNVIALSVFVIVVHTVAILIFMGLTKYKKRTSFLTAITLAQISEFSFILMAFGKNLGQVNASEVSTVVVVGVITMTLSSYLVSNSNKIYAKFKNFLSIFESKSAREEVLLVAKDLENHVVLVGGGRTGKTLISFFRRNGIKFLVIDYNPGVFSNLTAEKVPVLLGDLEDTEVIDLAGLEKAKAVISTVSTLNNNLSLLSYVKGLKKKPIVIVKASSKEDALKLYGSGATYVLLPEIIAGEYLRHIFASHGIGEARLKRMGKGHFNRLISYGQT